MKEDLLRAWLPAWTLNDFDLALLHKVTVLHDVIECFDLECRVEKATLHSRSKHSITSCRTVTLCRSARSKSFRVQAGSHARSRSSFMSRGLTALSFHM